MNVVTSNSECRRCESSQPKLSELIPRHLLKLYLVMNFLVSCGIQGDNEIICSLTTPVTFVEIDCN